MKQQIEKRELFTGRDPDQQADAHRLTTHDLAHALAELGYPGFSHLRTKRNFLTPEQVVIETLSSGEVEVRILEALPWLLVRFPDLEWDLLTATALAHGWQNRLGYIASIAAELAERIGQPARAAALRRSEAVIEPFRSEREETLCHESMTQTERNWLREHRPAAARRWRILSDLAPEHIVHVD